MQKGEKHILNKYTKTGGSHSDEISIELLLIKEVINIVYSNGRILQANMLYNKFIIRKII